jgi:O-antigen/teichoic acid export membrane protein
MPWLLETWMADMVKLSWPLIAALAVWTVIESTASVLAAYMNGANILRAQVLIAIVMALAAFGGKWILVPWVGVVGATLSTILAYSVISLPAQFFIFKSIFKNEDR